MRRNQNHRRFWKINIFLPMIKSPYIHADIDDYYEEKNIEEFTRKLLMNKI